MKNLVIAILLVFSIPIFANEAPWIAEDSLCEAIDIKDLGYNVKIVLCVTVMDRLYVAYIVEGDKRRSHKSWLEADWKTAHHFFPWVSEAEYQHPKE